MAPKKSAVLKTAGLDAPLKETSKDERANMKPAGPKTAGALVMETEDEGLHKKISMKVPAVDLKTVGLVTGEADDVAASPPPSSSQAPKDCTRRRVWHLRFSQEVI